MKKFLNTKLKITCPTCPDFSNNQYNINFEKGLKKNTNQTVTVIDLSTNKNTKSKSLF